MLEQGGRGSRAQRCSRLASEAVGLELLLAYRDLRPDRRGREASQAARHLIAVSPFPFGVPGAAGGEWVFDYVVAINFNRVPGRSPLDMKRPDPSIKDGGIWLHVAGRGATRGCISVSRQEMRKTLRWLDPAADPVIVMGPRGFCASSCLHCHGRASQRLRSYRLWPQTSVTRGPA